MSGSDAEKSSQYGSGHNSSESSIDSDGGEREMPIPYSYEPSSSDSDDTPDTSGDASGTSSGDSDRLADTSWLVE